MLLVFVCVFVFDLDFQIVTVPPFLSSPHGLTALTGVFSQKKCVRTKIKNYQNLKQRLCPKILKLSTAQTVVTLIIHPYSSPEFGLVDRYHL